METNSDQAKTYRLRFLEYLPPAVDCMAVTKDERLLAVGRENGQIEIYLSRALSSDGFKESSRFNSLNKTDTWTMIHVLPGIKNCDVRRIVWYEPDFCSLAKHTNNAFTYRNVAGKLMPRRLITTGLNGAVIDWDLINLQPRKIIDTGDVGIWDCCLHNNSCLLLACDDGAVRIVDMESFTEQKRLPAVEARCLSVCSSKTERNTIYAGYSDKSIRKWHYSDSGNNKLIFRMENHKECNIWTLCEVDSFLISGDSNGDIIVWDKRSGNSLKTFNESKGDILTLTANQDQKAVYASGVDSKVILIRQVHISNNKQKHYTPKIIGLDEKDRLDIDKDWVYVSSTRGQSHDIRSLIYLEKHHCLISAGVSTDLCVYSLEKHGKLSDTFKLNKSNKFKKFIHVPQFELKNQVMICTNLNRDSNQEVESSSWQTEGIMIVLLRKTFTIELWMYEKLKKPVFLLEFEKKGDNGITSVCIDQQARFVCITDTEDANVYSIKFLEGSVSLERIPSEEGEELKGIIHTQFINEGENKTILTFNNYGEVKLLKIDEKNNLVTVSKNFKVGENNEDDMDDTDDEQEEKYAKHLTKYGYYGVCCNEKYIAYCKFDQSQLFCYEILSQENFKLVTLENKNLFVTLTKLLTSDRLIVCYDSNKFLIHNLKDRELSKYSKQNLKSFPSNYLNHFNRIYGVVEISESKFILYTHYTHTFIDLNEKIPEISKVLKNHQSKIDTRVMNWNETLAFHHKKYMQLLPLNSQQWKGHKTTEKAENTIVDNFKIDNKYKGILHMSMLDDGTLVVVENVWKKLVKKLPNVIKINKFGQ